MGNFRVAAQQDKFMKHNYPGGNKVKLLQNIQDLYMYFDPFQTANGHMMSLTCEQPVDELTLQVWILWDQTKSRYCTLYVSERE